MDKRKLHINIGDSNNDYSGGDFLNALDEVVCYFYHQQNISLEHIALLMTAYAKNMED